MSEPATIHILFVCTGNTCRSPMAEGFARHLCRSLTGWTFGSAGVCAGKGAAASPHAVEAMRERGIDISGHRSQPLSPPLVTDAFLLVALTGGHADLLRERFPEASDKIRTLHSFSPGKTDRDVLDPFGGSRDSYRKTRDEIESALSDLILTVITPSDQTSQESI